nr:cytochrome c oxidase subunit 2 [Perkinsela sp. CCAP 1560/4]
MFLFGCLFCFGLDCFMFVFCFSFFLICWFCIWFFVVGLFCIKTDSVATFNTYSSSKYSDLTWFSLGMIVAIGLITRMIALLYVNYNLFACFDVLKVFGFQWYWVYYVGFDLKLFVVHVVDSDLLLGDLRLLLCMNSCWLFSLCVYKLVLSSSDVVHSFVVVCLGLKVDLLPGLCVDMYVLWFSPGLYYGQCSELCGVLHGFMPVMLFCV